MFESPMDLIVGMGSPHGDDQVGWRVVNDLPETARATAHVLPARDAWDFVMQGGRMRRLWIVDGCRSGLPPGTVQRLEWPSSPLEPGSKSSSHGTSVGEALKLLAALGRLPEQVVLWAIEIGDPSPGETLSPEVAAAVPEVQRRMLEELRQPSPGRARSPSHACTKLR